MGGFAIALDGSYRSVTVHFSCSFEESVKFESNAVALEDRRTEHKGKMEVEGRIVDTSVDFNLRKLFSFFKSKKRVTSDISTFDFRLLRLILQNLKYCMDKR